MQRRIICICYWGKTRLRIRYVALNLPSQTAPARLWVSFSGDGNHTRTVDNDYSAVRSLLIIPPAMAAR